MVRALGFVLEFTLASGEDRGRQPWNRVLLIRAVAGETGGPVIHPTRHHILFMNSAKLTETVNGMVQPVRHRPLSRIRTRLTLMSSFGSQGPKALSNAGIENPVFIGSFPR
jgi:hypothetical protein